MIKRFYVNNFRCFENFELVLETLPSSLLIGKNGTGKSTVGHVLQIFQSIARGFNRTSDLAEISDFTRNRSDSPMRFELEARLKETDYKYVLVLELPTHFKELRIQEERFEVSGTPIFTRQEAQVSLHRSHGRNAAEFWIDWHTVALPIIQEQSSEDPLYVFRKWLAQMIILAPIPKLIYGESSGKTLQPHRDGTNFANWLNGLLEAYPGAYSEIFAHLQKVLPDLTDFYHESTGKESKSLLVRFNNDTNQLRVPFDLLSDGEKCFFINAVAIATMKYFGPLFCFWDEPDAFLALSEIRHFVMDLRRLVKSKCQILMTSHSPETIRSFSENNTNLMSRNNHLEPPRIRLLQDVSFTGDKVNAIISGDLENGV